MCCVSVVIVPIEAKPIAHQIVESGAIFHHVLRQRAERDHSFGLLSGESALALSNPKDSGLPVMAS
jgi:hypothetical protein